MHMILPALIGTIISVGASKLIGGTSQPQPIMPLATPQRDDAAAMISRDEKLARRRGASADMLTGSSGAEASSSSIGRLVVGS